MHVYSTDGQTHQSTSTCVLVGVFSLIQGAKQSLLKGRWNAFASPVDTFTYRKHVSVFLSLPFQSKDTDKYVTEDEQSLSLATYQLTTCINLTLWAYDPTYLLQVLTTLLTSFLHSPRASISPPFFLLLLLACLLLHQQLLVLHLPWFNKGFPPLPLLQLLLLQHCTDTLWRASLLTGSKLTQPHNSSAVFKPDQSPGTERQGWHTSECLGKGGTRNHCRKLVYHWTAALGWALPTPTLPEFFPWPPFPTWQHWQLSPGVPHPPSLTQHFASSDMWRSNLCPNNLY